MNDIQMNLFGGADADHDPGGRVRIKVRGGVNSDALFAGQGNCYRYWLERRWDGASIGSPGFALAVLMNPSVADVIVDDPTVAGFMDRAAMWGYGAGAILNAFAYRATDKMRLLDVEDPVGPDNNFWIEHFSRKAGVVVVGWGQPPRQLRARGKEVAAIIRGSGATPMCFAINSDGSPKHPLYVRRDAPLKEWVVNPSL